MNITTINMSIDLNSDNFDSKSVAPFNNGKAGIVKVTIQSIEKNTDNPERHYWVITYQDENGGTLKDFYNYLDPNHANIERQLRAQGITLKHLWEEIVGKVALPKFENTMEMLDTILSTLKNKSMGVTFQLVVDYGIGERQNTRLNRKRYVPFIERYTEGAESKLFMASGAHEKPAVPTSLDSDLPFSLNNNSGASVAKETTDKNTDWLS